MLRRSPQAPSKLEQDTCLLQPRSEAVPLVSKLFRGDSKLQACLVNHAAHVTQGAQGDHVGKIQTALFILDGSIIDNGELAANKYGPSTADAVLAYKTKRRIINLSYQTRPDNIVGKMTIAALDKEMFQLEMAAADPNSCAGKKVPLILS
jgi:hypothetical protein